MTRRKRMLEQLDQDIREHLERETQDNIDIGMSPEDARYAALRRFGNVTRIKEQTRQVWSKDWLDNLVIDVKFASRQLLKHPGFTCTVLTVLAFGVAASVSIFAFVDAALIKPLPYADPDRLVTVFEARPDGAQNQTRGSASYLDFIDWRARNRGFESIAGYDVRAGFTLESASGPQSVRGLRATSGFFHTLGVAPVLGREFLANEEGPSAPPTVMLAYNTWQNRFGGDPNILGRTVTLQTPWLGGPEPHVIVGVLPRDFQFAMAGQAEFWTTIRRTQACWSVRSCRSLEVIARLKPGFTAARAAADMTAVVEELRKAYPDDHREPEIAKLVRLRDVMLGSVRPTLLLLLGGAGLLLLIAYINVMGLLLARTDSRAREIAVRDALGASPARLFIQFATEGLLLSVGATLLGLAHARWGMQLLKGLLTAEMMRRMPYFGNVGLTYRVIAFASVLAVLGSISAALIPFMRRSELQLFAGIKEGSRGSGMHWRRLGTRLIVAELSIALLLLVTAGLLGKTLDHLLHADTGFNSRDLWTVSVSPISAPANAASSSLASRIVERVAALPGVQSVGYADMLPLAAGMAPSSTFWVIGRDETKQFKEDWPVRRVSAQYFDALQATLLRGRYFTENEILGTKPVMIINDTAARHYFRSDDALGRSIAFGGPDSPAREIVGVIADIKDGAPDSPAHSAAYVPCDQSAFTIVVRSTLPQPTIGPSIVATIHGVAPDALIGAVKSMTDQMNVLPSVSSHRATAWLVVGFAVLAFVLSIAGIYGVVGYSVGQRSREIGVRMALGAQRASVYRLILGEAAVLIAAGTMIGSLLAVSTGELMRHFLFDVQAWDPQSLVTAAGVLGGAALLASYIPARRAAMLDPIEVLRAE